jgi:hypothetical protein
VNDLDDSNVFHVEDDEGDITANVYNGIFVTGNVDGSITWSATEVPFVVYEQVLSIPDGGSLSLGDGVALKLWATRIDVANSGSLSEGDGVVYTSLADDEILGDTNGDGTDSEPATGDWIGINFCKPLCELSTAGNIFYGEIPES